MTEKSDEAPPPAPFLNSSFTASAIRCHRQTPRRLISSSSATSNRWLVKLSRAFLLSNHRRTKPGVDPICRTSKGSIPKPSFLYLHD
ncbi:hypothetical protein F2Q68_00022399 [Brassica cretica]|uniref:Uncharacterized protein n=1 Tax=Brassica cretica TaxID=69181 RepID=A0A8S9FRS6_BRACR|nr:hypothetical protein F2Q68_00022399 [Brassica cretica]